MAKSSRRRARRRRCASCTLLDSSSRFPALSGARMWSGVDRAKTDRPARPANRGHELTDRLEYDFEFAVELALERRTLARQSDIRLNRLAQMDEGSHDFDVHANRPRAAQDARKHRDALLGEGIRRRPTA